MTLDRPRWQERAACRDVDDDRFFDESDPEPALRMCRACPVLTACREDMLQVEARAAAMLTRAGRVVYASSGFWGVLAGLLPWERFELVSGRRAPHALRWRGTRRGWREAAS